MTTTPAAATTPAPASQPSANNPNSLTSTDFMDLLTAQLKNQDPTNPVNPTQFVGQLVQFNSLEQLLSMKADLDTIASAVTAPTPSPSNPTGGTSPAAKS